MRFICARCEAARQMLVFLHVPKTHTHELYIFQQYTHSRKTKASNLFLLAYIIIDFCFIKLISSSNLLRNIGS